MHKASGLQIAFLALFIVGQILCGCSSEKRQTFPTDKSGTREGETSQIRMIPEDRHEAILGEALADHRVQVCCESFALRGLGAKPMCSATIEGTAEDGTAVTVTILTFLGQDSSVVGLVAYIKSKGQTVVDPCLVQSNGASVFSVDSRPTLMEDGVGEQGYLIQVSESSPDSTGNGWQWGRFWHCAGAAAAASFAACSVGCLPTGPLYLPCVGQCTGAWTLGGAIGCALMQVLD